MNLRNDKIKEIEQERLYLEESLNKLIKEIKYIPIGDTKLMPFGWRKAAKGRTVWRIIEEVISQNLEKNYSQLGFDNAEPASSEVGVYDFKFSYDGNNESYVNIKSSVLGGRKNKDDISKAIGLLEFYEEKPNANLYVATFVISFQDNMTVCLEKCIVYPTSWIPDVYVNPSNNGNLQSSKYKDLSTVVERTPAEFVEELKKENQIAIDKKKKKDRK
ncbi:hypothetical protein [Vagococcus fluvialis]|uniref:hypothetical protein n=2 Tax=Vagococcus fluvialis TaxID=2738 RepID=UPI003B598D57